MAQTAARQGAALTCFVAHTRAREAQTEPHLPPRRPLPPIPFSGSSPDRVGDLFGI